MASNMVVPSSRHTLFMRGFHGGTDMDKIRDYFTKEGGRCTFDFFKYSDDNSSLCVAIRFDSKDVAKEVLNRFDNSIVLGSKIYITWFKDHRRARAKAEVNWRSGRQPYYNSGGNSRSRYGQYRRGDGRGKSRKTRSSSRSSSRSRSRSRNRSRSDSRSHTWSRSRSRSGERSLSHDRRDKDNSPEIKSNKRDSFDKSPDRRRGRGDYREYDDEDQGSDAEMRSPKDDRFRRYENKENRERYRSREKSPGNRERKYSDNFSKFDDPTANSKWADDGSPSPPLRHSDSQERLGDSHKSKKSDRLSADRPRQGGDDNPDPRGDMMSSAAKRNPRYEGYELSHAGEDEIVERVIVVGKSSSRNGRLSPSRDERGSPRRRSQTSKQWESSDDEATPGRSRDALKVASSVNLAIRSSKLPRDASEADKAVSPDRRVSPELMSERMDSSKSSGDRAEKHKISMRIPSQHSKKDLPENYEGRKRSSHSENDDMGLPEPASPKVKKRRDYGDDEQDNQHMRELNYGPEKGRHRTSGSEAAGKNESSAVGFVLDRGQLGLDANAWKKVQEKKAVVEKAYRQDCETFATVVKMLISKDPNLEDKLQHSLKENLEEIGQRCIHEMKAFIEQCKKSSE